jgi:hypothetical protein
MLSEKVHVKSCEKVFTLRYYHDPKSSWSYKVVLSNEAVLNLEKPLMVDSNYTMMLIPEGE